MKFIDIGANLTDSSFQGIYHGTQKHKADLSIVLSRSWQNGLEKIIITVGSLNEADEALKLAKKDNRLYATMGCHPTRCNEFEADPESYLAGLIEKIENNSEKIIAIGEMGLDYDRLQFCDKEVQKKYFEKQLDLVEKFQLPMFLHCRNAHDDFIEILERNRNKIGSIRGVVHSFDGSLEHAKKLIDMGFYIGINGCSLKTDDNLEVIREIPSNKILLETDCPWCSVRPSHAGSKYVKTIFATVKKKEKWAPDVLIDGRSEPCQIKQVLEVIAGVKNEPVETLADIIYENTLKVFFIKNMNLSN